MNQIIINGIILGASYALCALGITLIFSIMNILNFAHGQMYMIGSFIIYYLYGVYKWNYFISLIICACLLALIGVCFERFIFRRAIRITTREESIMLVAMGGALLLENGSLLLFGEKQRGISPISDKIYHIFGSFIPEQKLLIFIISLILIIFLLLFIKYTKIGMAMRAIAQDREASYLQGVDVNRISMIGFAIGASLAGLAGGLLALTFPIFAGSGMPISIKSFIMIIIGGAGVVSGAIVGGFILGMLEAIGYGLISGSITYFLIFVAVIILLLIRPHGIMGKPWG